MCMMLALRTSLPIRMRECKPNRHRKSNVFPIRDDNPQILVPYATLGIIAVNVFVWVFVQGLGSNPALAGSICQLGLIPGELLGTVPAGTEVQLGAETWCELGGAASWPTLFT